MAAHVPLRLIRGLVALVLAGLPAPALGQQIGVGRTGPATETTETNRAPIIPFLEGTDVFWTIVKKDALNESAIFFPNRLEANIFPHLVFYQNFTDILDIDRQAGRAGKATAGRDVREIAMVLSGTPAVRIRMLRDRSAPVRTPSYMPRGNFQFLWVRGLNDTTPIEERGKPRSTADFLRYQRQLRRVSIWELHTIAGHHSNGQDGCLSTEQALVPPPPATDGECMPPGIEPTAETMNRIDGSFSSAFFFRFGGNYSLNLMSRTPTATEAETSWANRELRFTAEYEWHPRQWVDKQMRDIYGLHRMNLGTAYATRTVKACQRRFEVSGGLIWNPGVVDPELDWSGHLQVSCYPWLNGGWGIFARWYAGQDYYNVGFLDDINRLQVGMTFNQADFFRFRRRPQDGK